MDYRWHTGNVTKLDDTSENHELINYLNQIIGPFSPYTFSV